MFHSFAEFCCQENIQGREGGQGFRVLVLGILVGWSILKLSKITLNSQLLSVFKFLPSSDDKKGVDRASTVIARDVNEGMTWLTWH